MAGGITYEVHARGIGWMLAVSDGGMAGTEGQARRLEAVRVSLTGDVARGFSVWYRVHAQKCGWMAWAKNGEKAGTQGLARRAEAVQVVLVKKGSPAPGKTFHDVTQTYKKAFLKK